MDGNSVSFFSGAIAFSLTLRTLSLFDRLFSEPRLAELYDAFCAGRPDFEVSLTS